VLYRMEWITDQNLATALSSEASEVRGVSFYGICFLNFEFLTLLYNLFSFVKNIRSKRMFVSGRENTVG
jgi:hypothetical protein